MALSQALQLAQLAAQTPDRETSSPTHWQLAVMATGLDRAMGMGLVALAGAIFSYYTIWVILMPFVDEDHLLQQFFLPRFYAIALPVVAGLLFLTFIGVFVTAVTLMKKKKTK